MALGSFFSNLFQKKDAEPSAPASVASAAAAAGESGEARIRRRLAVDQAVSLALSAAGLQAEHYKHDAKRMDPNGQRFMVTIDLNGELVEASAGKLSQVGAAIVNLARSKGETEVTAVYWRLEPGATRAGPVRLLAGAERTENTAKVPSTPVASEAPLQSKEAASEKIARLRAMMKPDDAPAGSSNVASSFEKTQVIEARSFQATQVMDEDDKGDRGKSGKA